MLNKIYNIKDVVFDLLSKWPEMRDNDRQLMLNVWARQDMGLIDYRFKDFATDFKNGKYADPESIRRTRQKLQELHPELRGRTYMDRQRLDSIMSEAIKKMRI